MRQTAFTLWELLVAVAIAGVALGLAVPTFQTFVLDSVRSSDVNGFVLAVQLARSEAAKRGRPVVVCRSVDGGRCAGPGTAYDRGWIVFVDDDDVRPPQRDPDEALLRAHFPRLRGSITGNRALFEFRPYGRRSTNGTITFCDQRGPPAARAVIVSYTGRPRVSGRDPQGRSLDCGN